MTVLETKELKKYYGSGDTQVKALDGVDLTVENGEFVAIVGTSGSGKSTLLHMLGGLDRPTGGSVLVEGRDIFALKDEELTIFRRRKIGFVFQSYNLVPVLSVYDNIVLPIQLDGGRVDETYVDQVIEALGLEQMLDRLPNQLSGGQQQRVAIARALATKPAILLADEPTGALDSRSATVMLETLSMMNADLHATIMMVTPASFAASFASRILFIILFAAAVVGTSAMLIRRRRKSGDAFWKELIVWIVGLLLMVWWVWFIISGSLTIPFARNGFRMVVFSVIIMIVVLFFRRGMMGDKEFTDLLFRRKKTTKEAAK